MACATGVVKFVVFLFNFLCAVVGLALIVLGSVTYASLNNYDDTDGDVIGDHFFTPAIFIIVIGVIIFLIAFFGCCGVVRKSHCMLITYAIILIVLFIAQLSIGVYAYLKVKDTNDIKTEIKKGLNTEFSNYKPDNDVAKTFDSIQNGLECCGVDSSLDYVNKNYKIPNSCYPDKNNTNKVYDEGCGNKLNDWIIKTLKVLGYVAMGISATELLCAMLALCLSSSMRNDLRRHR